MRLLRIPLFLACSESSVGPGGAGLPLGSPKTQIQTMKYVVPMIDAEDGELLLVTIEASDEKTAQEAAVEMFSDNYHVGQIQETGDFLSMANGIELERADYVLNTEMNEGPLKANGIV